MAGVCLASLAIFAGGLSLVYGLGWYRDRKQNGILQEIQDYGQM